MSVYIDSGTEDYSVEAASSKVFASEALQRSGSGFMRGHPDEQITRDCRILSIFEGTNEVLRLYIALSALKILRSCRNFYVGPRVLAHGQ
jgi:acyl-CoA dehydrogenase family member 9